MRTEAHLQADGGHRVRIRGVGGSRPERAPVAEGPLPAVCIVLSASTEEKFPIQASRYRWADPRLIRRQFFRHCLQEREVDGRDDRRDLSASARDQHRLPSEGRTIDRLREVVAKLVCADGRENLGKTEVIELRSLRLRYGQQNGRRFVGQRMRKRGNVRYRGLARHGSPRKRKSEGTHLTAPWIYLLIEIAPAAAAATVFGGIRGHRTAGDALSPGRS